jgi:acyl-CoA reductase-like NAD-dependent aldehyde dehydrogenase
LPGPTASRSAILITRSSLPTGPVFRLGASIYTASVATAMLAATELQAGTVWINDPLRRNDAAPFGGVTAVSAGSA